jgi:hypothetical protein
MVAEVNRIADGELLGGRRLRPEEGFRPWLVPSKIEGGDGLMRPFGSCWWREWRGGSCGCVGIDRKVAVAVVAGEEEGGPFEVGWVQWSSVGRVLE